MPAWPRDVQAAIGQACSLQRCLLGWESSPTKRSTCGSLYAGSFSLYCGSRGVFSSTLSRAKSSASKNSRPSRNQSLETPATSLRHPQKATKADPLRPRIRSWAQGVKLERMGAWGDHLAKSLCSRRPEMTFLHSSLEGFDPSTDGLSDLPRIEAGYEAPDDEIGW